MPNAAVAASCIFGCFASVMMTVNNARTMQIGIVGGIE